MDAQIQEFRDDRRETPRFKRGRKMIEEAMGWRFAQLAELVKSVNSTDLCYDCGRCRLRFIGSSFVAAAAGGLPS
jgi:hypothetical protein